MTRIDIKDLWYQMRGTPREALNHRDTIETRRSEFLGTVDAIDTALHASDDHRASIDIREANKYKRDLEPFSNLVDTYESMVYHHGRFQRSDRKYHYDKAVDAFHKINMYAKNVKDNTLRYIGAHHGLQKKDNGIKETTVNPSTIVQEVGLNPPPELTKDRLPRDSPSHGHWDPHIEETDNSIHIRGEALPTRITADIDDAYTGLRNDISLDKPPKLVSEALYGDASFSPVREELSAVMKGKKIDPGDRILGKGTHRDFKTFYELSEHYDESDITPLHTDSPQGELLPKTFLQTFDINEVGYRVLQDTFEICEGALYEAFFMDSYTDQLEAHLKSPDKTTRPSPHDAIITPHPLGKDNLLKEYQERLSWFSSDDTRLLDPVPAMTWGMVKEHAYQYMQDKQSEKVYEQYRRNTVAAASLAAVMVLGYGGYTEIKTNERLEAKLETVTEIAFDTGEVATNLLSDRVDRLFPPNHHRPMHEQHLMVFDEYIEDIVSEAPLTLQEEYKTAIKQFSNQKSNVRDSLASVTSTDLIERSERYRRRTDSLGNQRIDLDIDMQNNMIIPDSSYYPIHSVFDTVEDPLLTNFVRGRMVQAYMDGQSISRKDVLQYARKAREATVEFKQHDIPHTAEAFTTYLTKELSDNPDDLQYLIKNHTNYWDDIKRSMNRYYEYNDVKNREQPNTNIAELVPIRHISEAVPLRHTTPAQNDTLFTE